MNKQEKMKALQKEADKVMEFLEDLEQRGNLESNKQARTLYKQNKAKLENIIDQLTEIQKEERGNNMEMKIEKRNNEFETELRALQTTNQGQAIIPENVEGTIVLKMEESSPVFARARKINSVSGSLKVAKETSGLIAGFVGEGADILEGSISFDEVKLEQKRVGAAISMSNQLLNDSAVNLEEYATNLLARRTAKAVEKSMLVGNGGDEFRGVINDADVEAVAVVGAVNIDNLLDLYLSVAPEFLQGAMFVMSREFFNQIAKLKDGNGHFYMQNGIVNGKLTYTLFGAEVTTTDVLPATTPVVFGNFEEAVSVLVKKQMNLTKVVTDTTNALRGSSLFVFDAYMDSCVTNPQAIAKMTVA